MARILAQEQDTIAAIATGQGGGIGMVRLSGPESLAVAGRVFFPRDRGRQVEAMGGYTGAYGQFREGETVVDDGVLFAYRAPKSYTGEEMAELCCHGGGYVMERVLALCLGAGARLARPGEFTRRALQNGKLSLTQAEGVADIISAQSGQALCAARELRQGALHRAVMGVADRLTDTAAHIAAWIDYPEEDVEEVLVTEVEEVLCACRRELDRLTGSYHAGRVLREGISAAIVGSPNVGKSTLMNLLAGEEKSIVTEIPGTTRDVIREQVRVGEVLLNLSDTAGLRQTDNRVEMLGVARSLELLDRSSLVLAVFDAGRELDAGDIDLLKRLDGRLAIGVLDKCDLPLRRADGGMIRRHTRGMVELSAKAGTGVEELGRLVGELTGTAGLDPSAGIIANQRQLSCALRAVQSLDEGLEALGWGQTLDAVSVCVEEALDSLLELTGQRANAEIIDRVFENFCVGK